MNDESVTPPRNRLAQKRGRPSKAEQVIRDSVEPLGDPTPLKRLACTRCGSNFEPKIIRTVGDMRHVRCHSCGYTHTVNIVLAAKLGWAAIPDNWNKPRFG